MAGTLSNLFNNFSKGIHKIKCKYGDVDKKVETCVITYEVCECFLEYTNFKNNLIEYKCLCCNNNHQQKFDEKLKKRFYNTYKFSNHITISLFCCCEKVFIIINIWMIWKNSMKHDYLKKKTFTTT